MTRTIRSIRNNTFMYFTLAIHKCIVPYRAYCSGHFDATYIKIGLHLAKMYDLECLGDGKWVCKRAFISIPSVAVGNIGSICQFLATLTL